MLLARALPCNGTVYLEGRPGEGKSAIIKALADKTDRQFIDIRLSQLDETDIGLFPQLDNENKCLNFVVPRWAIEANARPTIILFDELNRAQLPIRNAALQILLERRIGWDFKFNDKVLLFAAGNEGGKDGCDVEEFDAALWGRLIHVKHSMTLPEWIEGYAKEHVWDMIIQYLSAKPENLYKWDDKSKVYASHRSWTFLSDFVKSYFGGFDNVVLDEAYQVLSEVGGSYVGASIIPFLQYIKEQEAINIKDIIDDFELFEDVISEFTRSKLSELVNNLKRFDFEKFTPEQLNNVEKFLRHLHEDELVSYFMFLIDGTNDNMKLDNPVKTFINERFDDYRLILKKAYKLKVDSESDTKAKKT
jgi:hypothetical protein